MASFFNALPGAVAQGLIWGIMAIGVFITFRLLDIADLTVDGSFCTGGAVCVMMILAGYSPAVAMLAALIVGMIMGFYNSLFGPGVGTVAIIGFTMLMHYDARVASGNGKVLIVLTNAIALVSYIKTGSIAYEIAAPAALSAIAGNLVGVNLAIKKGEKIIKPVMLVVVILTVVKFALENNIWG